MNVIDGMGFDVMNRQDTRQGKIDQGRGQVRSEHSVELERTGRENTTGEDGTGGR